MKEINVGIRIDPTEGLSFTGIEEVNGLINRGGKVASIEGGGAVMRKLGEGDGKVRMTLSGCDIKVIVDDADVESSPQTLKRNELYRSGCDLISPYMQLERQKSKPAGTPEARDELERGIDLLTQAISIDPAIWAAHWMIGKAHQALGDREKACDAFEKAYGLQKGHADVAREYMFECLNLSRTEKAIAAARHAVALKPDNAGLMANLGLALFIGGRLDEAAEAVAKALETATGDEVSQNLKEAIADVQAGRKRQPTTIADLDAEFS